MYYQEDNLFDAAKKMLDNLESQETDKLHKAHKSVWDSYWDIADITIEADDSEGYKSQLATRMALYHLMRAKAREENRSLVCPKGKTSEVYFGSVFWDMDIFIQPFFIYTNQLTARTTPMCHNMILAANIGEKKVAYDSWKASMDIDFGERPRAVDGIHCANVGGMWQQIVHGFAGVVTIFNTDILTFHPCIPDEIKKISFKLFWKKDLLHISVSTLALEVENLSSNSIRFMVNDKEGDVDPGKKLKLSY